MEVTDVNKLLDKCPYSEFFWSVFSCIQSECGKIRTRNTPNMDTVYGRRSRHSFNVEALGCSAYWRETLKRLFIYLFIYLFELCFMLTTCYNKLSGILYK